MIGKYYVTIDMSNGSYYLDVAEENHDGTPKGFGSNARWADYADVEWFRAMSGHVPLGAKVRNGISDERE